MRRILPVLALACACGISFVSCRDEVSELGGSLVNGEVTITVDSLVTDMQGQSLWIEEFDSRTTTKLLGNLTVPEYGNLKCSFVSQFLCSTKMNVPDSITEQMVDSARLLLSIPRGALTGDSLAPQQLKVFRLNKALPKDISSRFNPDGYYDPSDPFGVKSYTVSNISQSDSSFTSDPYVFIPVKLPKEFGLELFRKYRAQDPMFQWPSEFAKWLPGIYVEQNFGNGCVASVTGVHGFVYWHRPERVAFTNDSNKVEYKWVTKRDSVCLLASGPEVLSSNNINYTPGAKLKQMAAQGKSIVTSPGGYITTFKFPIGDFIKRFLESNTELSVVSALTMHIPARKVENDYDLGPAPYMLMVPLKEREAFFRENKLPDNKTSFYCTYDSDKGTYDFTSMRSYFMAKLEEYRKNPADVELNEEFCLVPVLVSTETVQVSYNSTREYVTRVAPYMAAPTMVDLDMDHVEVVFTFSSQVME